MPMTQTDTRHPHRGEPVSGRQQILVLYLGGSDLKHPVAAWSFHDGTGETPFAEHGEDRSLEEPPYRTGSDALRDGWRLIAWPRMPDHGDADQAYELAYLPFEFVFEKWLG